MPDYPIEQYEAAFMDALGEVIRERRTARDWTQRDLAETAGVHLNVIGSVERGRSSMRLSTLVLIAGALETTTEDVVGEAELRARRGLAGE
jgi:transcriptional regulator with XRE-family HTH domain